jgi:polyisoprenoid-binding protein YceI
MRTRVFPLATLLIVPLLLPPQAPAQSAAALQLLPESRVWVDGTSNRDDWSVRATEVEGQVSLQGTGGELRIQQGRFSVASGKMQGGRSAIMDRLMHTALKANEHPNIVYELVSAAATPAGDNRYNLQTRGRLTLAGVTREIEGSVEAERLANGHLRFTGSYPLLMSDYGMTPPTAMFGALRTGDEVVVNFELVVDPAGG